MGEACRQFLDVTIEFAGALYALRNVQSFEYFHVALVLLMYTPVRFCLDFLRVVERLYFGLTPGQYFAAAFFLVAVFLIVRQRPESDPGPVLSA